MPISNEDIANAAQALQDSRNWEAHLAFSQVLAVTRHSLHCIDNALSDQVNGYATYESAHQIVLEFMPHTFSNESLRREAVVDYQTAMAIYESLKIALIECAIEEAKARAGRLVPLMKAQPAQVQTTLELADAKAVP